MSAAAQERAINPNVGMFIVPIHPIASIIWPITLVIWLIYEGTS